MLGSLALRPLVLKALVREFRYVYAAIGPQEGTLDRMVAEAMNTDLMGTFMDQVRKAHPDQEVVMVLDGASPHRAKGLPVPDNIQLVCLPPYSPELNPTENLWHELREKFCSNRVFDTLDAIVDQVKKGLADFSEQRDFVSRLSGWLWIMNSMLMNAK